MNTPHLLLEYSGKFHPKTSTRRAILVMTLGSVEGYQVSAWLCGGQKLSSRRCSLSVSLRDHYVFYVATTPNLVWQKVCCDSMTQTIDSLSSLFLCRSSTLLTKETLEIMAFRSRMIMAECASRLKWFISRASLKCTSSIQTQDFLLELTCVSTIARSQKNCDVHRSPECGGQ
jgi:hypothetical protein